MGVGRVLLLEALSVIAPVASFKLTGRRLFRGAPSHHHFQFLGWSEPLIVRRFWLAGAFLAALGIAGNVAQALV